MYSLNMGHILWPEVVVYSVHASAAHALTHTRPRPQNMTQKYTHRTISISLVWPD